MLLSVSPSVSAKLNAAIVLILTSMQPNPTPLVNCDNSKIGNACVQGVTMLAIDITAMPHSKMYFEFHLPVSTPAIKTPMVKPSADSVKEKPTTSNGTSVCAASNGNDAPGKTLRMPVQI